jgi:four helix bundle suffix protein
LHEDTIATGKGEKKNEEEAAMKDYGKNGKNENYGNYGKNGKNGKNEKNGERVLQYHGDYRTLFSYQKAEVIYDITFRFCQRFLSKFDRTVDQMVQAARSGKQNIIEGSKAAVTSKETEIKLTNVARASLEELLEDYRDFLRVRNFPLWDKESKEVRFTRNLGRKTPLTFETYRKYVETRPAEIVANIAICLICQATFLLDHQLHRLESDFVQHGGLRERMTRTRLEFRTRPPSSLS